MTNKPKINPAKINLDPCSTGHWWVQDAVLHVYCEYCPATGRVIVETPEDRPHVELRPAFIEPTGGGA